MEHQKSKICYSTVSGMFYPSERHELLSVIRSCLKGVTEDYPVPKAIITPHAGYNYSGPVAASALACLKKSTVQTIAVLGLSHRLPFSGVAVTQADYYETPLGQVPIDQKKVESLLPLPQVIIHEQAFVIPENSVDTQIPFLQVIRGDFKLVPLLIGNASDAQVVEVMGKLLDSTETLIVVSSDLSHYYDYSTAKQIDEKTAQAVLNLAPDQISDDQACGATGVRALLSVASKRKWKAYLIDLRNSGDISHEHDHVVGYGAFHFR